jgi:hypothetical protein
MHAEHLYFSCLFTFRQYAPGNLSILEIWMIHTSNSGYLYMNYYLHIFFPLMHFDITCITDTYDLLVN